MEKKLTENQKKMALEFIHSEFNECQDRFNEAMQDFDNMRADYEKATRILFNEMDKQTAKQQVLNNILEDICEGRFYLAEKEDQEDGVSIFFNISDKETLDMFVPKEEE